jgi:pSer/pThr/pTyr-binding forkhead associated (FHA) protein
MKGDIQEFTGDSISIGRDPSCSVRFPSDLTIVSRKHADIISEGNQFKFVDHSANGTLVNGTRVKEIVLKNGDVITFADGGPKVSFLAELKELSDEDVEDLSQAPGPIPQVEVPREPRTPRHDRPEPEPLGPRQSPPRVESPTHEMVRPVNIPLVIQYGPTIRSFKVLPMVIGKNPRCEFVLNHPAILDLHAQIFFSQDEYWIRDLTERDLVCRNLQPIRGQSPLRGKDNIALSPQGPVFLFLGDGRLVEVGEPEEKRTDTGCKIKREVRHERQEQSENRIFQRIKKVFKL